MRLATFTYNDEQHIGVITDDGVVDLSQIPGLPTDMLGFIQAGDAALDKARGAATPANARLALDEIHLEVPIANPPKILAIGLNYADHVEESKQEPPKHQIWFNKQANTAVGPTDNVIIPAVAPDFIDYEAELCLIIGKHCRHVPRDMARDVIFGFTCGNDVSVRDWQLRTPQFTLGKSFASHAPIGPWIVTPDEFGDPHDKELRGFVNGELRQSSNTKHLIFDCYDQIAELSSAFPLQPGDIIFTGTPAGVGGAMKPPRFLRAGDEVMVEIEGIGSINNKCVDEGAPIMEIH